MTLEELKDAPGGTILIDGIPAILKYRNFNNFAESLSSKSSQAQEKNGGSRPKAVEGGCFPLNMFFLPQYSHEELENFTAKVLDMFSSYLILGVSDEVLPPADIERIRVVSRLVS